MRKKIFVVTALTSCILCSAAWAEDAPKPATPRPGPHVINSMGPAGGAYPEGVFGVVINYVYADKDRWYRNGHRYSTDQSVRQNLTALKFRYGLGNGWDIRTSTPIPSNKIHNNPKLDKKRGVGDTIVVVRNQFMSQAQGAPLSLGAGLGLWLPTGGTNLEDVGGGAWGGWAEFGATYDFDGGRQTVAAEIGYLYRGDGGNKALNTYGKQSDIFRANARYAYALSGNFDLGVEAQYEHGFEGDIAGKNADNAYDLFFAGPSATLKIPSWKATLGVSTQFSLYQDYNAHTPAGGPTPASLGESWRLEVKLTKAF